jgi:hypothetical protein
MDEYMAAGAGEADAGMQGEKSGRMTSRTKTVRIADKRVYLT